MKKILIICGIAFTVSLALGTWYFTSHVPRIQSNNNGTSPVHTPNTNDGPSDEASDTSNPGNMDATGNEDTSGQHIYVSFASHNEDQYHPDYPSYITEVDTFWEHRNDVLAYATMLKENGVRYDFQTDWNFLQAVLAYDSGASNTNGKNIIEYLHEDLNVDIDAHSHENGGYNYVDVAYLIEQAGVTPTGVVGGFIAGPPDKSTLEYFWTLSRGEKYPNATWKPEILWGGGTGSHQDESSYWTSGVWYPKDANHFDEHDPNAPLPNVGHYLSSWDGLDNLLDKLHNGELDDDGFYTITIMINQSDMGADVRNDYEEHIKSYADEVANGDIIYATITETFNAWKHYANGKPTNLIYDGTATGTGLGSNGSESNSTFQGGSTSCGDEICSFFERRTNSCPADCN